MDTKYNVGQEVYVMYYDLLSEVNLELGCSGDVQELLKDIANMTVKKDKIEAIHIYRGDLVKYETAFRGILYAGDISLNPEEVRNSAIKKLRDLYVRPQIKLLTELDEGLAKLLDKSDAARVAD